MEEDQVFASLVSYTPQSHRLSFFDRVLSLPFPSSYNALSPAANTSAFPNQSRSSRSKQHTNTHPQLPHLPRNHLPLHNRLLLPAQTSIHIPLRPLHRIQHHLPLSYTPGTHPPPLRLHGIRHLHQPHKRHLLRHARDPEPR